MKTIGKTSELASAKYLGVWPGASKAYLGSTGGLVIGAPTGGDKGTGAVNATALYINNVAVSAGASTPTLNIYNAQQFL